MFAIIAAVPTILVAVVATITLDRGLDRFFSVRTKAIIENSLLVSEAYLREHAQMIQRRYSGDGAGRCARQAVVRFRSRALQQFLTAQATIRGLPIAVILNGELEVIERTNLRVSRRTSRFRTRKL